MIGIYLLVSIIMQLSPQNAWLATDLGPKEVYVSFDNLSGINVGAPVVAEGQLVGNVASVAGASTVGNSPASSSLNNSASKTDSPSDSRGFRVQIKIAPRHRNLLRRGTVALVASPVSTSRVQPETVLELLLPAGYNAPVLQDGESITGYPSYEEFWSAAQSKSRSNGRSA